MSDGFDDDSHLNFKFLNWVESKTSKNLKWFLSRLHALVYNLEWKKVLNWYLLHKLRKCGDKSRNNLATKKTLNFSGPCRRMPLAKLTNHSARGKRGHIVADTLLPTQTFPRLPARATFVADTKNVTDFVQKHFVSATNVSQFAQPKKHHGQQCVRNNVPSFTRAFRDIIFNNYSMSARWIWDGYSQLGATRLVGYNHLISNKGEWNNCFIKNAPKI